MDCPFNCTMIPKGKWVLCVCAIPFNSLSLSFQQNRNHIMPFQCIICLQPLISSGDHPAVIPCGHVYHKSW